MEAIRINIGKDEAEKLLDHLEENGIPRELFEELTDLFLEEYEKTPCKP